MQIRNEDENFKIFYISYIFSILAIGLIQTFLMYYDKSLHQREYIIQLRLICFSIFAILSLTKLLILKRDLYDDGKYFTIFRLTESIMGIFLVVYLSAGIWGYMIIIMPVIFAGSAKGKKTCYILLAISGILHGFLLLSTLFLKYNNQTEFLRLFCETGFFYIICFLFIRVLGEIQGAEEIHINRRADLLEQLNDKYNQLELAQEEISRRNDTLRETNLKLEVTNKKLSVSIAEFYTLQQISKAINSIFDIKKLMEYVIDIIIGVMGVNNCSILFYDENKKRLKLHTTSIIRQNELFIINDNINCDLLHYLLNSGKNAVENIVEQEDYLFVKGRAVNSMAIVPLTTKTRKMGLILVESIYNNAFEEENIRLLEVISRQVGIALENAELYQKMQDLARIDGLTGVYNRLYFHERLEIELENALYNKFRLSLIIFDIDNFKMFNDNYGHLFGDKVIRTITEKVQSMLRSTDIFARFGGEEFIILLPHVSLKEAYEKAENLRLKISELEIKDEVIRTSVTVSVGVSSFPETTNNKNYILRYADDALYEAKAAGRNCVKTAKYIESDEAEAIIE